MPRVAVIGLDAAEPQLIEQLMASGDMPNLASIWRRGAVHRLRGEATWRSGRVWETFLTGVPDFPSAIRYDPATYATLQVGSRRKPPFFAGWPGLRLLALDVPYLSLWYTAPGAQVIWGGHDAGYPRASHPPGLLREIDARFGPHPAFFNDFNCAWHHAPSIDALSRALIAGSRRRVEIARFLLERFPDWDLFMTVLSEVHSAGEIFWHGVDPDHLLARSATAPLAGARLLEIHRELDVAIGEIVRLLPPDANVVVCSVHGMQANHYDVPSMVLLPELLYRAEFGEALLEGPSVAGWRRQGCPPIAPPSWQRFEPYMRERFGASPRRRRRLEWERTHPRGAELRRACQRVLRRRPRPLPIEALDVPIPAETPLAPAQIDEPLASLDWQIPCWYRTHWPRMRAFALPAFYDARVRVNLRGRERRGRVPGEAYAATCAWVEDLVRGCRRARDGAPAVEHVEWLRAADPLDPAGPDADLVIEWKRDVDALDHPELGVIGPFPLRRTGGHTNRGFACLAGPGIAAGERGERDALDLTPTVAALLGRPEPEGLAGRSLLSGRGAAP